MQKTLLTTTLAIIGSFVVGSSALAAPSVVYKKQLSVPTVPASITAKAAASNWQYPSTTTSTVGFTVFKNVVLQKPILMNEKECGKTLYRFWSVTLDQGATKAKYPTLGDSRTQVGEYMHVGTKFILEARTASGAKWHIDSKVTTDGTYYPPTYLSPIGCNGNDLVLQNGIFAHPRNGGSTISRQTMSYASFDKDSAWKADKPMLTGNLSPNYETVDNLKQFPGKLMTVDGKTKGDSRVVTMDAKGELYTHTLPHYRDLSAITTTSSPVISTFYRLKDGYGVAEVDYTKSNYPDTTYYRIKNGESHYSIVDSLPFGDVSYFSQDEKGLTMVHTAAPNKILVHGLPFNTYETRPAIIWETDAQVYTHYLITNIKTGKQQYWEATVNKN